MSIDIKKAFSVPFQADGWKSKIGIPTLFILILYTFSSIHGGKNILINLTALIFWMTVAGYWGIYAHNLINNLPEELPKWDILKCLKIGILTYALGLGYVIICLPLIAIFYFMIISSIAAKMAAILLLIPVTILLTLISPIPFTAYVEQYKVTEAFNFVKIFKLFKAGFWDYVKFALWSIAVGIVLGIPSGIFSSLGEHLINKNLELPIQTFFVSFLIPLVTINLSAQTYKIATEKLQPRI